MNPLRPRLVTYLREATSSLRSPAKHSCIYKKPQTIRSTCTRSHQTSSTSQTLRSSRLARHYAAPAFFAFAVLAVGWTYTSTAYAAAPAKQKTIRLKEVQQHGRDAENIWIIKGTRVYDITDWIPNHPGGEVILRAAGGCIDAYWNIFTIHKKEEVYEILEQYFLGELDPQDLTNGELPSTNIEDPFKTDPERDERLMVHTDRPCNAESPISTLEDYITPNETFYVRNHLWVPEIKSENDHKITVELMDGEEVEYTVDDLRKKFKEYTVTMVLQCSGNRRLHMTENSGHKALGLQWGVGAIGNAEWTGVRLRDVLKDAGLDVNDLPDDVKHAQFNGEEAYGASIPIEKAIDQRGDVLLAYKMNGQSIPRDHGFPLRVIVPGHVAARSVKWIKKISLSDEESTAQWQRRDYKCFGPNETADTVDWEAAQAIQETPVQSAVTRTIRHGVKGSEQFVMEGYAYAGGGRKIVRVDVSPDNGETWHQAQLLADDAKGYKAWGWQRWKTSVPQNKAKECFMVKAVDDSNNVQPEDYKSSFNYKGNCTTAWERVALSRFEEEAG